MKRVLLPLAALFMLVAAGGCAQTYNAKASFLEGRVLVEYYQTMARGSSDTLTLTFYQPGEYKIEFSETPGKDARVGRGHEVMPQNITVKVDQAPRVHVISQHVLPDFLRVTITHNGVWETHDFQ